MTRKSVTILIGLFLLCCTVSAEKKVKYIFYFITDGTGVNTILGTEMFKAEKNGTIGREKLCMSLFPVQSIASTFSADNGVTDSAASGTALATGKKTKNGAIGMLPDLQTPVSSIATWAKASGMRVGIATSVPINHATPAAFYAHDASRNSYYKIGSDIASSDFEFFGGAEIRDHFDPKHNPEKPDLYTELKKYGYEVAFGVADYKKKSAKAKKIILVQDTTQLNPASGSFSIPYAIEAKENELKIEEILNCQIDFLMKDNKNGFFLMNEIGGKVDFACHAQDAATAFAEVEAVDRCMKIAYDFYLQHPDETLIVLTADHETGGLVLALDHIYRLNLKILENQKVSMDGFSAYLRQIAKENGNNVSWEMAKSAITECFGLWEKIEVTEEEEKGIKEAWETSFGKNAKMVKNEYSSNPALSDYVKKLMSHKALVSWSTRGHSGGFVPVYAIGNGSELFTDYNDNSLIPLKIAKAAGFTIPEN